MDWFLYNTTFTKSCFQTDFSILLAVLVGVDLTAIINCYKHNFHAKDLGV